MLSSYNDQMQAKLHAVEDAVTDLISFLRAEDPFRLPYIHDIPSQSTARGHSSVTEKERILESSRKRLESVDVLLADARNILTRRHHTMKQALTPVNSIPNEIMEMIFIGLRASYIPPGTSKWKHQPREANRMVVRLSHVSQIWRNAVLQHPRLWTWLDLADGAEQLQTWASRSGNEPLALSLIIDNLLPPCFSHDGGHALLRNIDIAEQYCQRWRSVCVHFLDTKYPDIPFEYERRLARSLTECTALEFLAISFGHQHHLTSLHSDLNIPRLRRLDVSQHSLHRYRIFCNLAELRIVRYPWKAHILSSTIARLAAYTTIQSLTIDEDSPICRPPPSRIILPALKNLIINSANERVMSLLSFFNLPKLATLHLNIKYLKGIDPDFNAHRDLVSVLEYH